MTRPWRLNADVQSVLKTILSGIGSFLLPAGILALSAWVNGLYPLGPEMFVYGDGRTQFLEFFAWYRDVLTGSADPFYTTTQALGSSTAALFGYYLASPFNLLLPLFNERSLALFCFVMVLLKAGCIQLTMEFYLRRRFKLTRPWACALALGFTLSLWTITQLRCPIWMDGLIFLPLCAWGTCCLLREGKWHLLALSFGACVLTGWYLGYIVGLFLCLYAAFEHYALTHEGDCARTVPWKQLLRFCGTMALGLALAAVTFLPSVLAMLESGTSSAGHLKETTGHDPLAERLPLLADVPLEAIIGAIAVAGVIVGALIFWLLRGRSVRVRFAVVLLTGLLACLAGCIAVPALQHGSFWEVMGALLYGQWVDSRTPQLFASFITLALAIIFFAQKSTPFKLKLAAALFLFLLLLSSWLYPLQYIWNGFRVASGFNSRMSFLFIFMIIWCAAWALRTLTASEDARWRFARTTVAAAAALALTVAGTAGRTIITWEGLYLEDDQVLLDAYQQAALEQAAELERHDPGVYRVEKTYTQLGEDAYNEGMLLRANQLSSYTSTGDQAVLDFLSTLGFGDGHYYTYALHPTLLGDSLFGVKYLSAQTAPAGFVDTGLTPVDAPEGARFYENPYALPLAYCTPGSITDLTLPEGAEEERLDAFAQAAWGREMSLYADADGTLALNMATFDEMITDLRRHGFAFDEFGGSRISGTVNAADDQVLLMTIPNQDGWSVTVNGNAVEPQDVADGALMAIPVQPGENRVEMQFTTPGLHAGAALSMLALLFVLFAPRIGTVIGAKRKIRRGQRG